MRDDIVTSLRMQDADYALQEKAADEIERLRAELQRLRGLTAQFAYAQHKLNSCEAHEASHWFERFRQVWIDLVAEADRDSS